MLQETVMVKEVDHLLHLLDVESVLTLTEETVRTAGSVILSIDAHSVTSSYMALFVAEKHWGKMVEHLVVVIAVTKMTGTGGTDMKESKAGRTSPHHMIKRTEPCEFNYLLVPLFLFSFQPMYTHLYIYYRNPEF